MDSKTGGAFSRLVKAIIELPERFFGSVTTPSSRVVSSAASGLDSGFAKIVNIPARLIERRPVVAGVLGILGLGALASHFLNGSAPVRTEDGLTPEEAGRELARERLINADNAAQRDVGMALDAMQQQAMMAGVPGALPGQMPPSRMVAGPTTMVGAGSYQGRMLAPVEQNLSV